MPKTAIINARIEPKLKKEVEDILERLGLNTSQAVTLFFKGIQIYRGLPFRVRLPNKETRRALEDARKRRNLKSFSTVGELVEDLDS